MIKFVNYHPHLLPKHACGNHFFLFHNPFGLQKRCATTSIHLPSQEVLEFPEKHALILHVQKLYQVRPATSTRHDYLGLVQFNLFDTYFCFK